jgi:signal-transduction protein with cAMP-binding, CBS, and nucleotidyltransferase domain
MAIFLGAKGGDIMATQGASRLLVAVREKLAGRMAYLLAGEDGAFLRGLQQQVDQELAFDDDFSQRIRMELEGISQAEYADQLAGACTRCSALIREHFRKRGSVIAFHGLCTAFHDLVVGKALALAEAATGAGKSHPVPCCLMASGSAGRHEFLPGMDFRYFLVHSDSPMESAGYFEDVRYRLIALLETSGLFSSEKRFLDGGILWGGSESEWRNWNLSRMQSQMGETFAILADLRGISGDHALTGSLKAFAAAVLAREQEAELFAQAVRKLSSMPVALGMFGTFKTFRSGAHRGRFNLDDAALKPLLINVRILAVHHGLSETGTIGRIKGLVDGGHLAVDLADRLLKAWHLLAGFRIRYSIQVDDLQMKELYLDPADLEEDVVSQLKGALEAVINLQKLIYQVFSE